MRVAYYCREGSTLSWQRRLFDEGVPILVYQEMPAYRNVGRGIVPLAQNKDEWTAWGNVDKDTLWFFDCVPDKDDIADRLRAAGKHVVGAGAFTYKLENDRAFGLNFAKKCGVPVPPTKEFSSVSTAIAFMRSNSRQEYGDGGWAWKADRFQGGSETYVGDAPDVINFCERNILAKHGDRMRCIVQERIPGVALSTARWWNGTAWTGPYEGTLENKKLMADNLGPATGCSLNTVWFYREEAPKIAKALAFDKVAVGFRAVKAPPGLYDINAIVGKSGAWCLEWTPRLGIDSELTSQRGIAHLGEFLYRVALGKDTDTCFNLDEAYFAVRLSVPPYPEEYPTKKALGVTVGGMDGIWNKFFVAAGIQRTATGFEVADPYGFIGIALASGDNLRKGYESVYAYLKKLKVANLQYRPDAYDVILKDVKEMAKSGWHTTSILEVT